MQISPYIYNKNNKNKDPSDASWLEIIVLLLICAFFPFLIIPYWIIRGIVDECGITLQNVLFKLFVIAFLLIIIGAPIITSFSVGLYGIVETYRQIGSLLAVTFCEIFFAIKHLWNKKIKKKLKLQSKKSDAAFWDRHPVLFPIYVISFCILFFVLFLSDVNEFFAFIVSIFGFYGMFRGLIN